MKNDSSWVTATGFVAYVVSLLAFIVVLFGGCQRSGNRCQVTPFSWLPCVTSVPKSGEDQATELVWRSSYGAKGKSPDILYVVSEPACAGYGFRLAGECVGGYSLPGHAFVAWWPDARFSDTSFAHELWHEYLGQNIGTRDPQHMDPGFAPGGAVDRAKETLAQAGL